MSFQTSLPSRKSFFYLFLITVAGLLAYAGTFQDPFHFDDGFYITENPIVKDPDHVTELLRDCLAGDSEDQWLCDTAKTRIIGYLTFALNYRLHTTDVAGYHLVNIGIHIINALLVYFFILLIFETPRVWETDNKSSPRTIALIASLLFVSHPVQTEAVTYLSQRLTSLATMFFLLSMFFYVKWRLSGIGVPGRGLRTKDSRDLSTPEGISGLSAATKVVFFTSSLVSAILAMETKEIAFTLPLVIFLFEIIFFKGPIRRRMLYLLPFLLTMLIIPMTFLGAGKPAGDVLGNLRVLTDISRLDYLLTQFSVVKTYVRLLFLPVNQNLDYDYPIYHSFFTPGVYLSFLFLLLIAALALYLLYRYRNTSSRTRIISFGILWFFITLSVESSIIPIVDVIFEHRVYLPSIGAFLALVVALAIVAEKLMVRRKTVVAVMTVFTLILIAAAYKRNLVWSDEVRLWEDVVEKSPGKARGYNNLAFAYLSNGQPDKAIPLFEKALKIDPNYVFSYNNLGNIYFSLGQYDRAIDNFTHSIAISPDSAEIYNNRGNAFAKTGRFDRAVEDYSSAIRLQPRDADFYFNRGTASIKMKDYESGIADLTKSIALNHSLSGAYLQRGFAYYLQRKDLSLALSDFQRACNLGNDTGCEVLRSGYSPGE